MFQHIADGVGGFGREDCHRGAAGDPDRQLGDDEMSTVFGQDGNTGTGLHATALQVCGHASSLVQGLSPGVVHHLSAANRLRQVDRIWVGALVVINVVKHQFGLGHLVSSVWWRRPARQPDWGGDRVSGGQQCGCYLQMVAEELMVSPDQTPPAKAPARLRVRLAAGPVPAGSILH